MVASIKNSLKSRTRRRKVGDLISSMRDWSFFADGREDCSVERSYGYSPCPFNSLPLEGIRPEKSRNESVAKLDRFSRHYTTYLLFVSLAQEATLNLKLVEKIKRFNI